MYLPGHFAVDDRAAALEIIREYPFALLISTSEDGPMVTSVPLVIETAACAHAPADALTLLGHLARGNPQWRAWSVGPVALAVFRGPDAYVSPARYADREAVPTWNYIAVEVNGTIEVLDERAAKNAAQKALITEHDLPYIAQWQTLPPTYQNRMLDGIVAFRLHARRVQAKFKLSQNRSAADRAAVRQHQQEGNANERALARWMERLGL